LCCGKCLFQLFYFLLVIYRYECMCHAYSGGCMCGGPKFSICIAYPNQNMYVLMLQHWHSIYPSEVLKVQVLPNCHMIFPFLSGGHCRIIIWIIWPQNTHVHLENWSFQTTCMLYDMNRHCTVYIPVLNECSLCTWFLHIVVTNTFSNPLMVYEVQTTSLYIFNYLGFSIFYADRLSIL
jgi:hypothetical protein